MNELTKSHFIIKTINKKIFSIIYSKANKVINKCLWKEENKNIPVIIKNVITIINK